MVSKDERWEAQQSGYIGCSECGHDVLEHDNDRDPGCIHCMCDVTFTDEQLDRLFMAYGMFPYVLEAQASWHDDLQDVGRIVAINERDCSVDVYWANGDGAQRVASPRSMLRQYQLL